MAIVRDVLRANIVLVGLGLLRDTESITAFSDAVDSDVILDDAGLIIGVPGGNAHSRESSEFHRERISVKLLPDRTVFEREFPTRSSFNHLAEVLDKATESSIRQQGALRAYGYNLELVYDQTSGAPSLRYLGDRLFGQTAFVPADWSLVGATGRLFFDSPSGRWTIQFEPRFNDPNSTRVFMSINLHKEETSLPDANGVRQDFESVWDQAYDIVATFDGGPR